MLSVVLVNWNGWADTISCIQSILNSDAVPFRIIVLDNMSPNDSLGIFEKWTTGNLELLHSPSRIEALSALGAGKPRTAQFVQYVEEQGTFTEMESHAALKQRDECHLYFVDSGRNGGFGFGCNVGMRLADQLGTTGYWLLNNDCVVPPDTLSKLSTAVENNLTTAFGAVVRYYDKPEVIQAYGGGTLSRMTGKNGMQVAMVPGKPLDYIYGASVVFSSKVRAAVGDFDEKIFMYFEEIDFCIRLSEAGYSLNVVEADVFHRQGASLGGTSVSAWRSVFVNKWYVLQKHFGWGFWCLFFWATLFVRCINPAAEKKSVAGARLALKALVFRKWAAAG